MSWINIDTIYLKQAGGEISGNLTVGGVLTVNNNLTVTGNLNGGLVVNGGEHTGEGTENLDTFQRKIFTGTVVKTVPTGADSVPVWTSGEFSDQFGRTFNSAWGDMVCFMNGDANAYGAHIEGCNYHPGDRKLYAVFREGPGQDMNIRINYLVVLTGNRVIS